jgi:hypothetical protein
MSRGYTFDMYTGWHCPWWVEPLLFLFSPSTYTYEEGRKLAKGFLEGMGIKED